MGEGFFQALDKLLAGRNGHGRAGEIAADRLGAAAKALGQECLGDGVERKAILRPGEAVAFVRKANPNSTAEPSLAGVPGIQDDLQKSEVALLKAVELQPAMTGAENRSSPGGNNSEPGVRRSVVWLRVSLRNKSVR